MASIDNSQFLQLGSTYEYLQAIYYMDSSLQVYIYSYHTLLVVLESRYSNLEFKLIIKTLTYRDEYFYCTAHMLELL